MTDAEYRLQVRRIDKLQKKWWPCLGLSWWDIEIIQKRDGPIDLGNTSTTASEKWICLGKAEVKWQYMRAALHLDPRHLQHCSDAELEKTFVHECCHILVHEMRCWNPQQEMSDTDAAAGMDHEERVVTVMTNAFLWTYGAGRKSVVVRPKKKVRKH